jgi:hypothetical protein
MELLKICGRIDMRRGFTLFEILLSISLSLLIGAGAFSVADLIRAQEQEDLESVLAILRHVRTESMTGVCIEPCLSPASFTAEIEDGGIMVPESGESFSLGTPYILASNVLHFRQDGRTEASVLKTSTGRTIRLNEAGLVETYGI